MKKISLMLALVMVLAMLFAISVFADEVIVLGPDQVVSATAEGTTYGSPEKLFDGDTTVATGGWYRYDGLGWTGGEGAKATIVFDKEYVIQSAQLYVWSNWPGGATFEFIDSKGNSVTTANAANVSDGTPTTIAGTVGVKFQTLVITMKGNKWSGNGFQMGEIVINAIVAPECTHDMDEYMDEFKITKEATCTTPAEITYECQNCGEDVTVVPTYADVTDNSDLSSVVTNGAGGFTSGPLSLYDNDINTYLHASGGWFVESEMTLNMNYYLTSATVVVGSWYDHNSNGAFMTFYYKAPGETEWITYGTMQTPVEYKDTKYTYTLEFAEPVLASAVKIRVDGLESFGGQAFEAQVAGSVLSDGGVLKHAWVAGETVAPTCVATGYTNYACSSCGLTKQADFVEETGVHTMADATCEAPSTCTVCGKTEGEALGHNYVPGEQAEDGSVTYTCANCNDVYVINNSAVNGEYFLGTDAVVFLDGVLTAMGNQYEYTYNVTTGMIDTNDETIYFQVIEGKIYFKGAEVLHQHIFEECVEEAQEDGSVNYVCQICGEVAFVVNNSAINGEYFLGTDTVVFADGVLTAMGSEYTYTYNVTTGMIDTSDAGIYFQVIDGVIYFRGAQQLHQHTGEGYVEEAQEDGSVAYICPLCGTVMYVINNSALNGTYYADLMTSFVFADGVLTANGETYNYTYNETTQELTVEGLPEGMLAVVDGNIYFRGNVKLHQHNEEDFIVETTDATCTENGKTVTICQFCGPIAEEVIPAGHTHAYDWSDEEAGYVGVYEYVAPTCISDGYVVDKCSVCGETYIEAGEPADPVWGHMAVEGSYEDVDATCNANGSYSYVCEYCGETISGVIEADSSLHVYGAGAIVDNKLVYTCEVCGGTEEKDVVVLTVGDNTITFPSEYFEWWGGFYEYETITAVIALPGKYVLTAADVSMDYINGRNNVTWIEEFPYEFEVLEGGYVAFNITYNGEQVEEATATITIAEVNAHVHTEEVIPAVLPTPNNNGLTAGVKCAECGEVLVEQVENTVTITPGYKIFGINSTDLVLGNNISLNFILNVSEGYGTPYMVFVFEGIEYTVTDFTIDTKGRPVFNFAETRPHKIATTVTAYVYSATENGYTYDVYEYSVMKYCIAKLNKNEYVDVISDLLVFGAATQKYVNPDVKDEELITSIVEAQGYTLTPSAFTSIPESLKAQYVDVDTTDDFTWKSSSVVLGSSTEMVYKFAATDITGLQIKIEVDGVEKMLLNAEDLDYDAEAKRYIVSVNCVSAVQLGSDVKATFVINGVESDSVTYSVNGFLYNNLSKNEGTILGDLMKALYVYGNTSYNHFYNN